MELRTKRLYEPAADSDGCRVLVDRLWPRGIKKSEARIALRKWFSHARERFEEFARRYREELTARVEIAEELLSASRHCNRTALLYAAKDTECNHAIVLLDWLNSLDKNSESRDPRPSLE